MIDTRTPTLMDEFTRGVKTALRLSALLMMAGCQGHWVEPETSVMDHLVSNKTFQQVVGAFLR